MHNSNQSGSKNLPQPYQAKLVHEVFGKKAGKENTEEEIAITMTIITNGDKDDIMTISVMTKVFLVTVNDFKPDNNCRNCDVFVVTEVSKLMLPETYQKIYNEELEGTEKKYGIYGHSINDLVLTTIIYNSKKNIITLTVDS